MEQPTTSTNNNFENPQELPKNDSNTRNLLKNFMFISLGFIVGIVLSWSIFFLINTKKITTDSTELSSAKTNPTTFPEQSTSTLTSVMGNWATYSNLNQGFSIDYPSSWSVVNYHFDWKSFVQLPTVLESTIALTPSLDKNQLEKSVGYFQGIEVTFSNLERCSNSPDYMKENMQPYQDSYKNDPSFKNLYPNFKIEKLNVKDIDGFIVTDLPGAGGREGSPTAYIFNCPTLVTVLFDDNEKTGGIQMFNQIISTVRVWKPMKLIPG